LVLSVAFPVAFPWDPSFFQKSEFGKVEVLRPSNTRAHVKVSLYAKQLWPRDGGGYVARRMEFETQIMAEKLIPEDDGTPLIQKVRGTENRNEQKKVFFNVITGLFVVCQNCM
jgi:hypothetical protein